MHDLHWLTVKVDAERRNKEWERSIVFSFNYLSVCMHVWCSVVPLLQRVGWYSQSSLRVLQQWSLSEEQAEKQLQMKSKNCWPWPVMPRHYISYWWVNTMRGNYTTHLCCNVYWKQDSENLESWLPSRPHHWFSGGGSKSCLFASVGCSDWLTDVCKVL